MLIVLFYKLSSDRML